MEKPFENNSFRKRITSMLKIDARRMFTSPFFYIMLGISFIIPILILVMTGMMAGSVSVNPQTGETSVMQGFENVWQIIGSVSISGNENQMGMQMDLVSMCNINMMYFGIAALVCVFIADDFRSGYAKNLFTVRAKKNDYVISKTAVCFIGGAAMLLAFFIGSIIGGAIAGLSFETTGFHAGNLIACLFSKMALSSIFVSIYTLASVIAKQRLWLSILLSFGIGMFLFTIVPMVSPLNAGFLHVVLCLAGGTTFAIGLGVISNFVLKKTALV